VPPSPRSFQDCRSAGSRPTGPCRKHFPTWDAVLCAAAAPIRLLTHVSRSRRPPWGPIPVASVWLTAILENGDLGEAWPWTAPALRRDLADKWLFEFPDRARGRDPDQLAAELAEQGSAHSDWGEFAADIVGFFHRIWHYVDFESWGWADLKNPIGVDREIVAIINVEGQFGELEEAVQADALPLVMELGPEGWKVVSLRRSDANEGELMRLDPRDE
jgi:hypothetical protein